MKKDYQRVVKELALLFFQTQSHLCDKILKTKRGMELVTSHSYSISPPPFCWGDNFQSQILKRGGLAKNECLGGLKEFLAWIFAWRAYILFFSPKKLLKMKYGFESSISNVVLNFEDLIQKVNETIYRLFTDHLTQIHKALFIYHVQFVQKVLVSTT